MDGLAARSGRPRGWKINTDALSAGQGIIVTAGGKLEASDLALDRNRVTGLVAVSPGSEIRLERARIANTRSNLLDGRFGDGLSVALGARGVVRDLEVVDNHLAGILVFGTGTDLDLRGARIAGTKKEACHPFDCDESVGVGLGVYREARVHLGDLTIEENATAGLQIASSGRLSANGVRVARHPIGLNLQDPAFDLEPLLQGLSFEGNEIDVDDRPLFVPFAED